MQREAAKERLAALRAENDRRTREAHAIRIGMATTSQSMTWDRLVARHVRAMDGAS